MIGRPTSKKRPPFGECLAAERQLAGLTQEALAAKLGVDRSLVRYYERNAKNPKMAFVLKSAAALGVEVHRLLLSTAKPTRPRPGTAARWDRIMKRARELHPRTRRMFLQMVEGQLTTFEPNRRASRPTP